MKIRFGVGLCADTVPDELGAIVDHLESTGVDSLWFSELVTPRRSIRWLGVDDARLLKHATSPDRAGGHRPGEDSANCHLALPISPAEVAVQAEAPAGRLPNPRPAGAGLPEPGVGGNFRTQHAV